MLNLIKPPYIVDENGEKVSVIIPAGEYHRIVGLLEDNDAELFDDTKNDQEPSIPFFEYVKQRRAE